MVFSKYCIQNKGSHCSPQEGVEGGAPFPGGVKVVEWNQNQLLWSMCLQPYELFNHTNSSTMNSSTMNFLTLTAEIFMVEKSWVEKYSF